MNAINRWMMFVRSPYFRYRQDTVRVFRFAPGNDMFFTQYGDNGEELARMFECDG